MTTTTMRRISWAEGKELYEAGVSIDCFVEYSDDREDAASYSPAKQDLLIGDAAWNKHFPLYLKVE